MIPIYELQAGQPLPAMFDKRNVIGDEAVRKVACEVLEDVRLRGDEAVRTYTLKFDGADIAPDDMRVIGDDVNRAYKLADPATVASIRRATENIRSYHEKQKRLTWMDVDKRVALGQLMLPIEKVGIYVPGGTAPLFSSVLMTALPAIVAGCDRIAMVTPPRKDGTVAPELLVAAYECGVKEIYKVGGIQAIGALAYGTQTIAPVDKIVGPGNIYVSAAKREVFGVVGIDMIAGPSEVAIVADFSARADWVAADMLSQAEHDALAAAYLITDNRELATAVQAEVVRQMRDLPRAQFAKASIEGNAAILLVEDMLSAIEFANKIAPEHLELCVDNPFGLLGWVRNAGAVFLGHFSPEPLGDYFAGPNHVLPTSGTARFFSPLSVDDYIKRTSVIRYSRSALDNCAKDITRLARAEGLEAHARSVELRLEDDGLSGE